jgi:hypothetical protein
MNRPRQIVAVGGCAIDYALRAEHLPSPGQSVSGDVFLRNPGGKGLALELMDEAARELRSRCEPFRLGTQDASIAWEQARPLFPGGSMLQRFTCFVDAGVIRVQH